MLTIKQYLGLNLRWWNHVEPRIADHADIISLDFSRKNFSGMHFHAWDVDKIPFKFAFKMH